MLTYISEKNDGFTLVELLVVVVILGLLVSIAVPIYSGVQLQAKWATGEANAKILNNGFAALQKLQPALLTVPGSYDGSLQTDRDALFDFLSLEHVQYVIWFIEGQRYVADPDLDGFAKGDADAPETNDPRVNPGRGRGNQGPGPPDWVGRGHGGTN